MIGWFNEFWSKQVLHWFINDVKNTRSHLTPYLNLAHFWLIFIKFGQYICLLEISMCLKNDSVVCLVQKGPYYSLTVVVPVFHKWPLKGHIAPHYLKQHFSISEIFLSLLLELQEVTFSLQLKVSLFLLVYIFQY